LCLQVVPSLKGHLIQALVDVAVDDAVEGARRKGLVADGASAAQTQKPRDGKRWGGSVALLRVSKCGFRDVEWEG